MNRLRIKNILPNVLNNKSYYRNFLRSNSSDVREKKSVIATNTDMNENAADFSNVNISTKLQKKLPRRAPVVKNFFVGVVDKEMIPFPEVIPRDNMSKLYEEINDSKLYFEQLEQNSSNYLNDIKKIGLFGLTIPQHLGGKGYFISESLIASEPESKNLEISILLNAHRAVVDVINQIGTDEQKDYYFPRLSNGSSVATEALYESSIGDKQFFNTTADFDPITKEWTLNGEKSFVINGLDANLFLVFAQSRHLSISGEKNDGITIFIVDESLQGITKSNPLPVLGSDIGKQCSLKFDNVRVPEANMLGTANSSNEIGQVYLKSHRLRMASINLGIMKNIIDAITKHCINTNQGGIQMTEMDSIGHRLSNLVCSSYATESMLYYTAGLMDEFENQDVALEAAVLKLYSLENLWKSASSFMNFIGSRGILSGDFFESTLRNSAQLYIQGESLDSLRLFVALSGLQHAGIEMNEVIKKTRNPLFHPGYIFTKFFERHSVDSPKVNLDLGHELHPTLASPAYWLEQSISRLEMGTRILFSRHGNQIIEKHVEIMRLTECVQLIFAMFASLSRASRSYCIGLKHSDYEMLIATTICLRGRQRVKSLITDIANGPFVTDDRNHQKIAKQIYKSNGYFSEHPLKYNF